MKVWMVAILGAVLIGIAVHHLSERSNSMDETQTDGLTRDQRQRAMAVRAALTAYDKDIEPRDVLVVAEYIRSGTLPKESE